jgi:hypothetical protein
LLTGVAGVLFAVGMATLLLAMVFVVGHRGPVDNGCWAF